MIVCAKCGFTQPRDVYCANCGINIEKYQPVKPPAWIRLLKDPYFQITSALIFALAAFFVIINQPAPIDSTEVQASSNETSSLDETPEPVSQNSTASASAKKNIVQTTQKLKVVSPLATKKTPKPDETKPKALAAEDPTPSEKTKNLKLPSQTRLQFFELGSEQVGNLFKNISSTISLLIVDSKSLDLGALEASPLPGELLWAFKDDKKAQLNFMNEPLDDSSPKGIKFSIKKVRNLSETGQVELNLRVEGNIPQKEGPGNSFDWARSFEVSSSKTVLIKVKLPHFEVPLSFLEDSYNSSSPLSVLSSPLFLEYKSELIAVLTFN